MCILLQVVMLAPPENPDDLVDAAYFARVTGLSERTVKEGKAGTKIVPVVTKRPRRWRRVDVDQFASTLLRAREEAARPRTTLVRRGKHPSLKLASNL